MKGAKKIRHKWQQKAYSHIDKQCVYCGLVKHWDDRWGRWIYMKKFSGPLFYLPKCVYPPNSAKPEL